MLIPEELGGGSLSEHGLVDLVLIAEEMGWAVAPGPLIPVSVVADTLARSGSSEQHTTYLEPLLAGDTTVSWAFEEDNNGVRSDDYELRAELQADSLTLSGRKTRVESATSADALLVTARLGDDELIQVLVPAATDGLATAPMKSVDLVRRFDDVTFDNVRLSAESIVGSPASMRADFERQIQVAAVLQAAETAGVLQRVFDMTLEYMNDRYSFGRPLSSYQALKHRMADNKLALESSMAIATAAAHAVAVGAPNAPALASAAKAFIGEAGTDLIQDCIQLHGGIGVTWEHDLHLYLRRALVNRVTYGTPEDHRELVAAAVIREET
jgi:alkylation response protein AidB-like acyl-CoA dehydrogenase